MKHYLDWMCRSFDEVESKSRRYNSVYGKYNNIKVATGEFSNSNFSSFIQVLHIGQPNHIFDRWFNSKFCTVEQYDQVFKNTSEFRKGLMFLTSLSKKFDGQPINFEANGINVIDWFKENNLSMYDMKEEDHFMFNMHFRKNL